MKNEIKIEWKDAEVLSDFIKSTYKHTNEEKLQINGRNQLQATTEIRDQLKGCNNFIVKIYNTSIVEGFMRFVIVEKEDNMYFDPISVHSIMEHNGKYIFI